ncbi:MAG TPA: acetyl-CoA carboxylase biotin carboxyl carrier protein [Bacillota bacterium]|nr:acetyl-CoA carboxylase biotin carboxyl carrier protein [Bacillota bacterium]
MLKIQEIRELIRLIDNSSIEEFVYETNDTTVSMKKSSEAKTVNTVKNNPSTDDIGKQSEDESDRHLDIPKEQVTEPELNTDGSAEEKEQATDDYEIVSPMVGTFYAAPSPESEPYVKVGSQVQEDTVVCIVEAMKLFNEIEAEVAGEITEVLVENGELVEYGQPLFRVRVK